MDEEINQNVLTSKNPFKGPKNHPQLAKASSGPKLTRKEKEELHERTKDQQRALLLQKGVKILHMQQTAALLPIFILTIFLLITGQPITKNIIIQVSETALITIGSISAGVALVFSSAAFLIPKPIMRNRVPRLASQLIVLPLAVSFYCFSRTVFGFLIILTWFVAQPLSLVNTIFFKPKTSNSFANRSLLIPMLSSLPVSVGRIFFYRAELGKLDSILFYLTIILLFFVPIYIGMVAMYGLGGSVELSKSEKVEEDLPMHCLKAYPRALFITFFGVFLVICQRV